MWRPVHLDHILDNYDPFDIRVIGSLILWIAIIFSSIWLSLFFLPDDWLLAGSDKNQLLKFFLFNPPMLAGIIILFWFGFEWAFIPVFMSMFIIGVFSYLPYYWAILFGLSFGFGLAIFALVYHCLNTRYDLRSLMSFVVFVITAFVASTASSLGSFIWSFAHDLSAAETAKLWNGWWTGSFLQSLIFTGPLLFLLSPAVEKYKKRWFELPKRKEVSIKWVYSAVILTTVVIAIFIYSGDYLAKQRISEGLTNTTVQSKEMILQSMGSFEIITWVSIWIIICVGLGGIFLIGSWNTGLQQKVDERTRELKIAEDELKVSLSEKVVLLQEIHHRVKNNLAVVTAMLDLQYMRSENEQVKHLLSDSKSRVKSMAFVHETLYETKNFSKIEVRAYIERLCKSVETTFRQKINHIDLETRIDNVVLEMSKAGPLGLILNELLVNSFKHAFNDSPEEGLIRVDLVKNDHNITLKVQDNGSGIPEGKNITKGKSLGITLIKTLTRQLHANFDYSSEPGNTVFTVSLEGAYESASGNIEDPA